MCGKKCTVIAATIIFLFEIKYCENTKMNPLIINGESAKIRKYPHSVYLYADCNGNWICGSSILNQKILLTAAHCLVSYRSKACRIDAFAGHEDVSKVKVKRRAYSILIHEKYINRNFRNDIGLILVKKNLPFGNNIKRVIITKQSSHGLQATVAGWGLVNDQSHEMTNVLMVTNQKVRSTNTCNKVGRLLPGMLCAGSFDKNAPRPYKGDSGSALITANYHQIGVTSFFNSLYPSVLFYTNISYYYDWIKKKSRLLYCG